MSLLSIARERRATEVVTAHVSCSEHETCVPRYGDAEVCRHCGSLLRPETPGVADLDMALASGRIDWDEYDAAIAALYAS